MPAAELSFDNEDFVAAWRLGALTAGAAGYAALCLQYPATATSLAIVSLTELSFRGRRNIALRVLRYWNVSTENCWIDGATNLVCLASCLPVLHGLEYLRSTFWSHD